MQTVKDYTIFSSLSWYRLSPLSLHQAEALSAIASAFVRIIFGLYLHVSLAFVLSSRRCFCLEDLRRRRRPPTLLMGQLSHITNFLWELVKLIPKSRREIYLRRSHGTISHFENNFWRQMWWSQSHFCRCWTPFVTLGIVGRYDPEAQTVRSTNSPSVGADSPR